MRSWMRYIAGLAAVAACTVLAVAHVGRTQPPPPPNQQVLEDITNTKHNLSSVDPSRLLSSGTLPRLGSEREARSAPGGTSEICVFCHTPHGATAAGTGLKAPLWNRNLDYQAGRTYQLYDQVWSFSFEGVLNDASGQRPTGYSRLCLSCHDGTVALGNLINAPGSGGYQGRVTMTGTLGPGGTIPQGSGDLTGDTRRLGLDLRNDHAISFTYDQALVLQDRELVTPAPVLQSPAKVSDPTNLSPVRLYPGSDPGVYNAVQCTSCHNPHQVNYPKFLRANWFHRETNNPDPTKNNLNQQIICLFCHDKPGWINSTHAIAPVIRNKYPIVNNDPANSNSGYDYDGNHTVAEYACRNCHDPHTIQGAKRLHREGVNAQGTDGIENTCYLCHSPNADSTRPGTLVAGDPTSAANPRFVPATGRPAPDVYSEFSKDIGVGNCSNFPKCGSAMNLQFAQGHEPVFTSRSQEGVQLRSLTTTPPPGNEQTPGTGQEDTAHIECVDCHNPHQVVRDNRLRGIKGISFTGQVVETTPSDLNRPFVYEVCFRCHGNSYGDIFGADSYPSPTIYRSNPRWPPTNVKFSMGGFSNKRLEFAKYGDAAAEVRGTRSGTNVSPPGASYVDQVDTQWGVDAVTGRPRYLGPGINKSFHPVVGGGRNGTTALKKQLEQWSGGRPAQDITIQCTDCHNSDYYDAYGGGGSVIGQERFLGPITESNTVRAGDVKNFGVSQDYDGERSRHPIGPHGSNNIRILRAPYNTDIANPSRNFTTDGFNETLFPGFPGQTSHWDNFLLCFQCHDRRAFDPTPSVGGDPQDPSWTNFFGVPASPADNTGRIHGPTAVSWESNLHMYHMLRTGALCHECHYNVHSNAEAQNTIYGDGTGCVVEGTPPCPLNADGTVKAGLPPDDEDGVTDGISDTHLINFAPGGPTSYTGERPCDDPTVTGDPPCSGHNNNPNPDSGGTQPKENVFEGVEGVTATKPVWYYHTTIAADDPTNTKFPVFRCNLRCHGVVMSTCFYIGNARSKNRDVNMNTLNRLSSDTWCAGGQEQKAPISFGAAPPAIQKFLADVGRGLLPSVGSLGVDVPEHEKLKPPVRHVRR